MSSTHLRAYVALGGNLPLPGIGDPIAVAEAACRALPGAGVDVRRRSRWYRSAPVPPSDQPDYVNGVLEVEAGPDPWTLLRALQRVEAAFGRVRSAPNAARTLDLDLLIHGDRVVEAPPDLILPHPRLHVRAFVLAPLAELAPDWTHPLLGRTVREMLAALPPGGDAHPISDEGPREAGLSCTGGLQPGGGRP